MKKKLGIILILAALTCTGCASDSIELTEEEINMAAEYAAGVLLLHDIRYDKKLLSVRQPVESPKEEEEKKPTQTHNTSNAPGTVEKKEKKEQTKVSVSEIYSKHGVLVSYKGLEEYKNYPKSSAQSYFNIEAGNGKKLLIYTFQIKNKSLSSKKVQLSNQQISYQLSDNSGGNYRPLLTVLPGDIQYLDLSIKSGDSKTAVLVFEVPKAVLGADCALTITSEGRKAYIK